MTLGQKSGYLWMSWICIVYLMHHLFSELYFQVFTGSLHDMYDMYDMYDMLWIIVYFLPYAV